MRIADKKDTRYLKIWIRRKSLYGKENQQFYHSSKLYQRPPLLTTKTKQSNIGFFGGQKGGRERRKQDSKKLDIKADF